jgi:hypothetical protein
MVLSSACVGSESQDLGYDPICQNLLASRRAVASNRPIMLTVDFGVHSLSAVSLARSRFETQQVYRPRAWRGYLVVQPIRRDRSTDVH